MARSNPAKLLERLDVKSGLVSEAERAVTMPAQAAATFGSARCVPFASPGIMACVTSHNVEPVVTVTKSGFGSSSVRM